LEQKIRTILDEALSEREKQQNNRTQPTNLQPDKEQEPEEEEEEQLVHEHLPNCDKEELVSPAYNRQDNYFDNNERMEDEQDFIDNDFDYKEANFQVIAPSILQKVFRNGEPLTEPVTRAERIARLKKWGAHQVKESPSQSKAVAPKYLQEVAKELAKVRPKDNGGTCNAVQRFSTFARYHERIDYGASRH